MTITHHPDAATLMSYAAGSLPEPLAAIVACHAAVCPACRREIEWLELAGGEFVSQLPETAMSSRPLGASEIGARAARPGKASPAGSRSSRTIEAVPSGDVPGPLVPLVGPSLDKVSWKYMAPGIRHVRLPLSKGVKGDLRLFKVAPGRAMPDHGHGGAEMTLLLAGSYTDEFGRFARGDVADLDTDAEHQPVADKDEGCICLIATIEPARYKGLLARLAQPFVGI
ncbi:MAG: ChrR family anti-sigma-E factor [Hyphomicrobiaceae bacterium]